MLVFIKSIIMKNILLLLTTFTLFGSIGFGQCWESIDVKGDTNRLQLAIQNDGTLWDLTPGIIPIQIGTDTDWDRCFTSNLSSFAIKEDSTLWGWGENTYGELGINNTTPVPAPIQLNTDKWISVSSSWGSTMAVKSDNTLWVWGFLSWQFPYQLIPDQVGSDNDWKEVHSDYLNVLALKNNGTIWNGSPGGFLYQVGTDNDWAYFWVNAVEWYGIKDNGTLWEDGVQVGTDSDWESIVGDKNYPSNTYAIKNDHTLWYWAGSTAIAPVQYNAYQSWIQVAVSYNGTYYAIDSLGEVWQGIVGDSLLPSTAGSLCGGLNIETSNNIDLIKVYPNPTTGKLFIDVNLDSKTNQYAISNIQGKIVSTGFLNKSENSIDISNYKPGIYFVMVENNKPIKIIKQ